MVGGFQAHLWGASRCIGSIRLQHIGPLLLPGQIFLSGLEGVEDGSIRAHCVRRPGYSWAQQQPSPPRLSWTGPHRLPRRSADSGWGRRAGRYTHRTWRSPGQLPYPASAPAVGAPGPHPEGWRPHAAPWRVLCRVSRGGGRGSGEASS